MSVDPANGWTADMVRALPDDGKRYEVIDGELFVTPAPTLRHQRAAFELGTLLKSYVATHAIGSESGAALRGLRNGRHLVAFGSHGGHDPRSTP
jgi:Uma2 family endonuclease